MTPIRINGHTFRLQTIVAVGTALTALVAVTIGVVQVSAAWGQQDQRITAVEDDVKGNTKALDRFGEKVGDIATDAAATTATVKAIKEQQQRDREHFDDRLDRLFEEIRKPN